MKPIRRLEFCERRLIRLRVVGKFNPTGKQLPPDIHLICSACYCSFKKNIKSADECVRPFWLVFVLKHLNPGGGLKFSLKGHAGFRSR